MNLKLEFKKYTKMDRKNIKLKINVPEDVSKINVNVDNVTINCQNKQSIKFNDILQLEYDEHKRFWKKIDWTEELTAKSGFNWVPNFMCWGCSLFRAIAGGTS